MNLTESTTALAHDVSAACNNALFKFSEPEWDILVLRQMLVDALDANTELRVVTGRELDAMESQLELCKNLTSYGQF